MSHIFSAGLCCGYGRGNYTVYEDGEDRIAREGNFRYSEWKSFGSCPQSLGLGSGVSESGLLAGISGVDGTSHVFKVEATSQLYILGFELRPSGPIGTGELVIKHTSGDQTDSSATESWTEASISLEVLDDELDTLSYLVTLLTPIELDGTEAAVEHTFYINALNTNLVSVGTSEGTLLSEAEDGLTVYEGHNLTPDSGLCDGTGCPEVLNGAIKFVLHHNSEIQVSAFHVTCMSKAASHCTVPVPFLPS